MKTIINALAALFPFFRHGSFMVLSFLMFSLSSCFKQYYQTNTTHTVDSAALGTLKAEDKHFIVHAPSGNFALEAVSLNNETISGKKESVPADQDHLLNPKRERKNVMSKKEKLACVSQVHLYTDQNFDGAEVNFTYNHINRMDVYGLDKKAIRASRVRGIVIVTLGTAAGVGLLFAAASAALSHSMSNINLGSMRWD